MKILFITSSRIGDAVLSTGLLDYLVRQHPAADITVVCGKLVASLFAAPDNVKQVMVLEKQSFKRHWLKLWLKTFPVRWDIVVDLRDSAVSRAIFARQRFIFTRGIDKSNHKVEQNAAVMGIRPPPAPRLYASAGQRERAAALIPAGGPVLGVGPTANWIGKTWPAERFIELIARLTGPDGILPGARVAVFAAPGEEAAARQVLASVPDGRGIDVIAKADPGTAAAALARCDFYIGNDSGLMHCAAAVGVPTFGLFGPSWPHIYRPWGNKADYISTPEDFAQLTAFDGYSPGAVRESLMKTLSVDMAEKAVRAFWAKL